MLATSSVLLFAALHGGFHTRTAPFSRRVPAPPRALFLVSDSFKVVSPCAHETAAKLASTAAVVEGAHWVAVLPGLNPLAPIPPEAQPIVPAFIANYAQPLVVGERPLAVGRLRAEEGLIELLTASLPKEDPQHAVLLETVLDHLLLAWLTRLGQRPAGEQKVGSKSHTNAR